MAIKDELTQKYTDHQRGQTHRHIISYGNLASSLRDKIAEADLTEHDLLEQIIIVTKQINLHLMSLTNEEVTEEDIEWP